MGHNQSPISFHEGKVYQWNENGWYHVPELCLGDLEGFELKSNSVEE